MKKSNSKINKILSKIKTTRYVIDTDYTGKIEWIKTEKWSRRDTLRQIATRWGFRVKNIKFLIESSSSNYLFNLLSKWLFFFRKEIKHTILAEFIKFNEG